MSENCKYKQLYDTKCMQGSNGVFAFTIIIRKYKVFYYCNAFIIVKHFLNKSTTHRGKETPGNSVLVHCPQLMFKVPFNMSLLFLLI